MFDLCGVWQATQIWPPDQAWPVKSCAEPVIVRGRGGKGAEGLDRILVVQQYRTPEMDYFSPQARPFLKGLVDRYAAAGD